ncbi:hypothetical protein V6N13_140119 [Hibiscus sabdariffa]
MLLLLLIKEAGFILVTNDEGKSETLGSSWGEVEVEVEVEVEQQQLLLWRELGRSFHGGEGRKDTVDEGTGKGRSEWTHYASLTV